MTQKKDNILSTAHLLFGRFGYQAISTRRIAQESGVSEGLIFRHFQNKEGLLQAIVRSGLEQISPEVTSVLEESDPEAVLDKYLDLPFRLFRKDPEFWRIMHALQLHDPDLYQSLDPEQLLSPARSKVARALDELGWENPDQEAFTLQVIMEGLMAMLVRKNDTGTEQALPFLKSKYF